MTTRHEKSSGDSERKILNDWKHVLINSFNLGIEIFIHLHNELLNYHDFIAVCAALATGRYFILSSMLMRIGQELFVKLVYKHIMDLQIVLMMLLKRIT